MQGTEKTQIMRWEQEQLEVVYLLWASIMLPMQATVQTSPSAYDTAANICMYIQWCVPDLQSTSVILFLGKPRETEKNLFAAQCTLQLNFSILMYSC